MLQAADFSIQIIHKKLNKKRDKKSDIYRIANIGDIHISDLKQIRFLFLRDGKGKN